MEVNKDNLQQLATLFQAVQSPDDNVLLFPSHLPLPRLLRLCLIVSRAASQVRKPAEAKLKSLQDVTGFKSCLLVCGCCALIREVIPRSHAVCVRP
jgi:hypothetical protein